MCWRRMVAIKARSGLERWHGLIIAEAAWDGSCLVEAAAGQRLLVTVLRRLWTVDLLGLVAILRRACRRTGARGCNMCRAAALMGVEQLQLM